MSSQKAVATGLSTRAQQLLDAGMDLLTVHEPSTLLGRFAETASRLVEARYGAVFIDDGGVLVDFVAVGIDADAYDRIGELPTRKGLHGFLLQGGTTVRIEDLTTDPRASGFPAHHPVMHSFLGTPIRCGGEIIGELYVTDKHGGGPFSDEDVDIVEALAAHAGVAWRNATLLRAEHRRASQAGTLLELERRHQDDRAVLRRLVWAQEEERARVARELHDDLGQILAAMAFHARRWEVDDGALPAEQLGVVAELVDQALATTRRVVQALRPVELDDLGLVGALERLGLDLQAEFGLEVDLQAGGLQRRPPPEVEIAAYRVAQEALTNTAKHARARRASLLVVGMGGRLVVVIEDDGVGFEPLVALDRPGKHLGLRHMRERAAQVGGNVTLESSPGHGAMVRLEVPLGTVERGAP